MLSFAYDGSSKLFRLIHKMTIMKRVNKNILKFFNQNDLKISFWKKGKLKFSRSKLNSSGFFLQVQVRWFHEVIKILTHNNLNNRKIYLFLTYYRMSLDTQCYGQQLNDIGFIKNAIAMTIENRTKFSGQQNENGWANFLGIKFLSSPIAPFFYQSIPPSLCFLFNGFKNSFLTFFIIWFCCWSGKDFLNMCCIWKWI